MELTSDFIASCASFDKEAHSKCVAKVDVLYLKGYSPSQIFEDYSEFYDKELIRHAIEEVQIERDAVIVWGQPRTLDGRQQKWNWYKGPNAMSSKWKYFMAQLEAEGHIGEETLSELDHSTSRILNLCASPSRDSFQSRGLVMGHVQSGKTTNFLGLAAKAADEGYRLVIILSGITNNLRDQTQARMESALDDDNSWIRLTQVGHDFAANTANAQALCGQANNRMIAVVKKNKSRLTSLHKWLSKVSVLTRATLPVLIIDDECDQATVNSGTIEKRTAINKALQDLLKTDFLPKASYVGYSATPFANILADAKDTEGIYPRDFIVSLSKSPGYFGAQELFGSDLHMDDNSDQGANIIRNIPNEEVSLVIPPRKKADLPHWEPSITPTLRTSIEWFILASAARRARGQANKWSSMMLHTSSNIEPHFKMAQKVQDFIIVLKSRPTDELIADLKLTWTNESVKAANLEPDAIREWNEVKSHIVNVLEDLQVIVDNSKSSDRLDYGPGKRPYPVIVVGGNTLSRGLTLEGLVSSFFLRTTNAYDSLMQMGRWFGYRPGYSDLQRIWLSNDVPFETANWFKELSAVEDEIRDQIEVYSLEGRSPSELGVRIKSLPGMVITARAKMKNAELAQIGYGGSRQQTILFNTESKVLTKNLEAVDELILSSGSKSPWEPNIDGWPVQLGVDVEHILSFVENYEAHPSIRTLERGLVTEYIQKLTGEGELLTWNVAIYSNSSKAAKTRPLAGGVEIRVANRSKMKGESNVNIKALVSLGDMVADMPELKVSARPEGGKITQALLQIERSKHAQTSGIGLLGIYVIDKISAPQSKHSDNREPIEADEDLVGYFMVFPETKSRNNATYYAPNISAQETDFEDIDDPYSEDDMEEEEADKID